MNRKNMPMKPTTLFLALLFVVAGLGESFASDIRRIDVSADGGAYAIEVHPNELTTLQFPAAVTDAFGLQPAPLKVQRHGQFVTLHPEPGFTKGSVSVFTERFPVSLLVRVVVNGEAAPSIVEFRDRDHEEVFRARVALEVERAMLDVEREREREAAELARKHAQLDQQAKRIAVERLAKGLTVRHRLRPFAQGSRKDDIVLRVHRLAWLGDDLALTVSVENRRGELARLREIEVLADGLSCHAVLAFRPSDEDPPADDLALLSPGERKTGTIVIPDARERLGAELRLTAYVGAERQASTHLGFKVTE